MTLDLVQHTVTTDDGARLAVHVHDPGLGDDAPTVVLAHGWTLSHAGWWPVLQRLADDGGARLVAWDQRGHGDSTFARGARRSRGETVRRLGDDLHAVLGQTAPSGPLVLGGHSMGGMTVMAYAGLYPQQLAERTRGVVLASTAMGGLRGPGLPLEAPAMRLASRVPVRLGPLVTERGQRRGTFGPSPDPADMRAARDISRRTRMSTFGTFYAALMAHDESAAMEAFGQVPVDVVVGTHDRLTPRKLGERLAAAIPGSTLHVEEGAGHMTPYERADLLADLVRARLP